MGNMFWWQRKEKHRIGNALHAQHTTGQHNMLKNRHGVP